MRSAVRGQASAGLALVLFLLSAQGAGFVLHMVEESAVDGERCHFDMPAGRGGSCEGNPGGAFVDAEAHHGKHGHDCSSCPICSQFLTIVAIRWSHVYSLSFLVPVCPGSSPAEPFSPDHPAILCSGNRAPPKSAQA